MTAEAILKREFTVDGEPVICRFYAPELEEGSYFCRYAIDWSRTPRGRRVGGVDSVQAMLLAMMAAHVDLLAARDDGHAQVIWIDQTDLGLPLAQGLRDLSPDGYF